MRSAALILCLVFGFTTTAEARGHHGGGGGSHHSSHSRSSSGYGTGSSSSSRHVSGYTTKHGAHVEGYHRTTADGTQRNNYNTKGNYNHWTGKTGSRSAKW
ncbi:MAG TPA: hypothetical protein VGM90_41580 [Kofleriaceae bacterium]